jgi:hypothetical protein
MPLRRAESLQAGRSIAGELPYWWVFGVDTVGLDSAMNPLDLLMIGAIEPPHDRRNEATG